MIILEYEFKLDRSFSSAKFVNLITSINVNCWVATNNKITKNNYTIVYDYTFILNNILSFKLSNLI